MIGHALLQTIRDLFRQPPALPSSEVLSNQPLSVPVSISDETLLAAWSHVEAGGRQVEVFDPTTILPSSRRELAGVVLFLHGHGQVMLSSNPVFSRLFHQHHLAAVCPDGGQNWWLDVAAPGFSDEFTPQAWLREQIVPMIEQRFAISPPRVALLGVSMGGQGVLQLAYRYASKFPVVAAISPAVDFYQLHGTGIPLDRMFPDAEAARQASVVLNLHPLAWPKHQFFCCDPSDLDWFDGCARLGMKLSSSGILHERDLETSAGGHSWDYFNHMASIAVEHIAKSLAGLDFSERLGVGPQGKRE